MGGGKGQCGVKPTEIIHLQVDLYSKDAGFRVLMPYEKAHGKMGCQICGEEYRDGATGHYAEHYIEQHPRWVETERQRHHDREVMKEIRALMEAQ